MTRNAWGSDAFFTGRGAAPDDTGGRPVSTTDKKRVNRRRQEVESNRGRERTRAVPWTARGGVVLLASVGALIASVVSLLPGTHPIAATTEVRDRTALRVCADPANVPFSNEAGEGFENKIADLIAAELSLPVHYTWFPQATGFIRNTLRARKCDVVIGIALGNELVQNTNPYYRSAYSLVYRADSGLALDSLGDPATKGLRLGVVAGTPPATLMAKYGLLGNVRPYQLFVDTRFDLSGKQMVEDVAKGDLDVAVLWGPIAGYYASRQNPRLQVVPLRSQPGEVKLDHRITMGVRENELDWKHQLNAIIQKKQPEINAILLAYGVPLLDERGNPITP